jgi:Ca-activated chloride channel homolog
MTRRCLLPVFTAALIAGGLASGASIANTPHEDPFTITSTVERVLLDVSVKDPRGGYVTGLKAKDFRVFENGRPEPVTDFGDIDSPVTVGLVLDDSGSMRDKRPDVITAGLAFAKESNLQDEFFLVNFNDHVSFGLPARMDFTDSVHTLRAALYMGNPVGQTALYDAVLDGLLHLKKGKQTKKTLIVVSDGGDNVSKSTQRDVLRALQASEATVYTVGVFGPEDSDRNPGVLQKFARVSGGEFYNPTTPAEVIPVFHKIAQDIRNRYLVGFAPDPHIDPVKHPVRSIRVTVTGPQRQKYVVRTRTSYTLREDEHPLH